MTFYPENELENFMNTEEIEDFLRYEYEAELYLMSLLEETDDEEKE